MWIDFEDKKPEENQEVLFTHVNIERMDGTIMKPVVSCGFYQRGHFHSWVGAERRDASSDRMRVTHWMKMPEPPTKTDLRDIKIGKLVK